MTLIEWVQTVKPDRASKVLAAYAIIMAVLQIVLQVAASIADGGLANGLPAFMWALIWWNARQKNFQAIFYTSLIWMALQVIGAVVLFNTVNTQNLNNSNPILIIGTIVVLMLWSFPAVVAHNLNRRLEESVSGEPNELSSEEVLSYQKNEKNTYADKRYKNENIEATDAGVGNDKANLSSEKVMNELETRYKKGRLAIQFREDAKEGWETIEKLPVLQKLEYLKWLSDDPKREVESIVLRLVEDHRKTIEPFNDEVLNNCYRELSSLSAEAAADFVEIVDTLGDTIDPISVKNIISNRRGKVGRRLVEYQSSLQMSLKHRWLPDAHFQHLFSDEFEIFVSEKKLKKLYHNEAWCLFIEDLYARCKWDPPSRPE